MNMKPPEAAGVQPSPWRIALVAMVALGVAMGIGRFIYTPLLPMMLDARQVNMVQGGWLASANNIGYFLGALLCTVVRVDSRQTIRASLMALAALTAGMGLADGMIAWTALRLLAGVAMGVAFVTISGWCLSWLAAMGRGDLGGIMYVGPGLGIMVGGIAGAYVQSIGLHADAGWLCSAAIAFAGAWLAWKDTARRVSGGAGRAAVPADSKKTQTQVSPTATVRPPRWLVGMHIFCYSLAGFGYIITATFLPVMAELALPGQPGQAWLWPLFGLSVALGALLVTRLPVAWNQSVLLGAAYVVQGAGVLITILFGSLSGFGLGSALLGLPFTAITLFGMREARRLGGERVVALMGAMSAAYALGQIVGPVLAAYLYDMFGSFQVSLAAAAAVLFMGAACYFWLAWQEGRMRTRRA